MIDETTFASSNLSSGTWDSDTDTLTIEFTGGSSYDYFNVPRSVWQGLKGADSAGSYFHRQIRGRYSYERT